MDLGAATKFKRFSQRLRHCESWNYSYRSICWIQALRQALHYRRFAKTYSANFLKRKNEADFYKEKRRIHSNLRITRRRYSRGMFHFNWRTQPRNNWEVWHRVSNNSSSFKDCRNIRDLWKQWQRYY